MWAKVAEEMAVPWRAVEAMHWQLGEQEMARRAGVTPFSLASTDNLQQHQSSAGGGSSRGSHRGHGHSRSQGSIFRESIDPSSRASYGRTVIPPLPPGPSPGPPPSRALGPVSRAEPPAGVAMPIMHPEQAEPLSYSHTGGPLAPIQTQNSQSRPGMLPGLAELTTGVSPYSTPAYSVGAPTVSPAQSSTASPGPFFPAMTYPPLDAASTTKRRRSPEYGPPEMGRRRHMESGFEQSIPRHVP
ncbi:hypothetical protein PFICI_15017 [Pestalotiopsis fici W106-1]|uniref:Uncharacterized protein n=1 Tax=Pestalotiopsis fici (strain W106-1 / CGMCC3.15140) TaxID=1229662 RepID=W3WJU1_PESFW|nr:uncharacterized protein PFICI_15017 [Pestalotiopsis fici W106-1]ETS73412.1 hypothetical protein PFICI_15017 [Pestalotiopsis fici W106-1]